MLPKILFALNLNVILIVVSLMAITNGQVLIEQVTDPMLKVYNPPVLPPEPVANSDKPVTIEPPETNTTTSATISTPTTTTTTTTPSPTITTPTTTTTDQPTSSPTPPIVSTVLPTGCPTADPRPHDRHFDAASFFGGIILTLGLIIMGLVVIRYRTKQNRLNRYNEF
ncbi:platelet glycoprotein Ib alpha chain-like [Oppia nitens]|uniref:platelet glycoprotein Ib alpha chain-like n=1 Tax=Oppia nitens TaxID=1686743 RepID=UPI0023DBBED2|nr:platelet glycoprotein Ib alpha chain-like [Oppia nitens]